MRIDLKVETNRKSIHSQLVPPQGIAWLFSCPDIIPIISIQGREGDENYAIYTTIGRAGGQADGLAHVPGKL